MPDITMCGAVDCPRRLKCYRFMAIPSGWRQTYFAGNPYLGVNKTKCEYFWPLIGKGKRNADRDP